MMGLMTAPVMPRMGVLPQDEPISKTVTSRFGDIAVDLQNSFTLSRGLLGFPNHKRFALSEFPGEKMQQFRLLQSLDDLTLSFITLPLEHQNLLIDYGNIAAAGNDLGIPLENMAVFLIVSAQRTPLKTRITANVRAPLFLDVTTRSGAQYVFQNDRYQVQQEIG